MQILPMRPEPILHKAQVVPVEEVVAAVAAVEEVADTASEALLNKKREHDRQTKFVKQNWLQLQEVFLWNQVE